MIVFKALKPAKLRLDAIRLEMLTMMRKAGRDIKKDFEKTVETWETEVKFDTKISLKGGPSVKVWTDNDIYAIVNNGSPPHLIGPKDPNGMLVFRTGFKAKTTPKVIGSKPGGKFGSKRKAYIVEHPGFEGRKFDETIQKKWLPIFKRRAEEAMKRVAKKSGHGDVK